MESFAVIWSESYHSPRAGKLELDAAGLRLESQQRAQRVYYEDIENVHVARDRGERLAGRPALVLDLAVGGPLRIASLGGVGILSELAERLGHVTATPLHV
ncbi:MAG TPA: hypothetical protein VGH92_09775 [Gaiellaceae bacterium]|jgi:hypothetical protein